MRTSKEIKKELNPYLDVEDLVSLQIELLLDIRELLIASTIEQHKKTKVCSKCGSPSIERNNIGTYTCGNCFWTAPAKEV